MSSSTSTEQLSTGNFTESFGYEGNSTMTATPSVQSPSQGQVMVKFSCLIRPFVQNRPSASTQHYLDSDLTSPVTSPTQQGLLSGSERSALLFSLTLLKLDSEFFDSMSSALDDWRNCIRDSFDMLRRTRLPTGASLHLSIAALLMQMLHRHCFLPLLQSSSTNPGLGKPPDSSIVLLYFLPMVVTVVSLAISVTLLLQLHPVDASVVSGLVALLVMECLVPVTVAACTGLFLAQAMTWDRALLLLVSVWIASSVSARCIRVSLYPSLGHGA